MLQPITIRISAVTMEGEPASDPQVTVDILEEAPLQRPVGRVVLMNFAGEGRVQIASPEGAPAWRIYVTFSRYDAASGFAFLPREGAGVAFPPMHVVRLPARWTPQFAPLNALPSPRFDPFVRVVAASPSVDLKAGPPVGDLAVGYDAMAGGPQVLAKAALLNLFAVLTEERDPTDGTLWFEYVRKFVRLDQERFVAEVEPAMFESGETILAGLAATYAAQGYSTEPNADLALHTGNIPPAYNVGANLQRMITIKKAYRQGNVQLTLSHLIVNEVPVHLLDCDMDEHLNFLAHGLDILAHLVNGGTHPVSMHEYIVADSAESSPDGVATIDLGYQLT